MPLSARRRLRKAGNYTDGLRRLPRWRRAVFRRRGETAPSGWGRCIVRDSREGAAMIGWLIIRAGIAGIALAGLASQAVAQADDQARERNPYKRFPARRQWPSG